MQTKLAFSAIFLSVVMVCGFTVQWIRDQNRVYTLTIATGGQNGEYYAFGQALSRVVAKHDSKIQIQVLETEGSRQNMQLLEQNQVQLAIVQSDTPMPASARAVAFLFPEMFHLIAAADADIDGVSDLKGKRIALMPEGSGSYALFWPLSKHYGLAKTDFESVILPPDRAMAALEQGKVDALFRTIALGNPAINKLLQTGKNRLVSLDQAKALQLFVPALEASQIPKGTYNGAIPIPPEDLPVVAVRSVLVSRKTVDRAAIATLTRLVFEARNDLVKQHPQAATIRQPDSIQDLGLTFHPGAKAYYNEDKPNFIVQYAEPLGLLLSISILSVSGLWQLRLWLQGRQKNRADLYNLELLSLIDQIATVEDLEQLATIRHHLFDIFKKVVVDLDEDRLSPESFQSFTFPWEVAVTAIRHREMLLLNLHLPETASALSRPTS